MIVDEDKEAKLLATQVVRGYKNKIDSANRAKIKKQPLSCIAELVKAYRKSGLKGCGV